MFVANSLDGVSESVERLGVDRTKARRVPNVIEDGLIERQKSGHNPYASKCPYVVCVSRLLESKRIHDILIAFADSPISPSVGLVIVGSGPAQRRLESVVASLGIDRRVTFTGHVVNPYPILSGATGFVSASECEGFSNAVLEAMFCDVPVVTSYCSSDAREMCAQGAALGFGIGDCKQLAQHIAAVVNDEALCEKLVGRAREYRSPHTVENAIPFYESFIRKLACDATEARGLGS